MIKPRGAQPATAGFTDLTEFLLSRKEELIASLRAEMNTPATSADNSEEAFSQVMQAQEDAMWTKRLYRFQLKMVNSALVRLAESGDGICANCGAPIPEWFVAAIPGTVRCADCQEYSSAIQPELERNSEHSVSAASTSNTQQNSTVNASERKLK